MGSIAFVTLVCTPKITAGIIKDKIDRIVALIQDTNYLSKPETNEKPTTASTLTDSTE